MHADPLTPTALRVRLESHLPASLPAGSESAVFCFGHCFGQDQDIELVALLVAGQPHRPSATRMPRRDLYRWLGGTAEDPAGRSYRSGFWATLPMRMPEAGALELGALVRAPGNRELVVPLGAIPAAGPEPGPPTGPAVDRDTIVICLASFNPHPDLLGAQIESLRAQTDPVWICLISDGGSEPDRFARLLELTDSDPRFSVSRSERRLGPYQNFERALRLVPPGAELVALCDQDDRWYPEKLATLRDGLGQAQLVYSDQRLVTEDGRVVRESLWQGRRNDHRNLASLLIANAVPGSAMLFRRSVLDRALPFPQPPGDPYHDHWLALVALASGQIKFIDRPLFDWVQHGAAASRAQERTPRGSGRGAYFGGYVLRQVQAQTLLLRAGPELGRRQWRALTWFITAERSVWGFLWLALRPLRRLAGRDETLGGEVALVLGIVWRWLVGPVSRLRPSADASFPDPPRFDQPRLRRWRTGA